MNVDKDCVHICGETRATNMLTYPALPSTLTQHAIRPGVVIT